MKELKIGVPYYIIGYADTIDTVKVAKIIIEKDKTTYVTEYDCVISLDRCYETIDEAVDGIRHNIEKDYQFRLKRMARAKEDILNKMKLNGQTNV